MADRISLPPTPPGLQDQMYRGDGGPQRMPTPPRSTLVVGGPAYFTPEGYEAPRQPVQSFMPTDTRPDPIGDQFRRANPPPPAQTAPPPPPPPVPAPTPAPISDPAPVEEPIPAPVDRGAYPPYIPGVTPFPGIPDFRNIDFSGLPGMGDIDMDRIIKEYQDRIDAGEPEPFDSFLPPPPPPPDPPSYATAAMADYSPTGMSNEQLKILMDSGAPIPKADYPDFEAYLASLSEPVSTPELEFVPPPQEPNGFFPGIDFSDFEDFDFSGLPNYKMPAPTMPAPQAQAPAPVYTPPPSQIPMQGMMDDYDFGNPNLRNMRGSDPRR